MAVVRNDHSVTLSIAGVKIPAGSSAQIKDWDKVRHDPIVKQWLDSGIIALDEDDEKGRLISELEKHGVSKDRRSSIETLRKEVEKVRDNS